MDSRRKLMAKRKARGRAGKLEERFRLSLETGNYYEAHQTLKVIYDRHISQGREDDGWLLLYKGTMELLGKSQWESGTEVALMLVEHLKERKTPVTDDTIDKLENIFRLYKCLEDGNFVTHPQVQTLRICSTLDTLSKQDLATLHSIQVNRDMFVKSGLKWTSLVNENMKYGHVRLHRLLALAYFEEGEFERSCKHFLYANMPEEFGQVLVETVEKGDIQLQESEMYITRAVLQLLVLGDKESAYRTYLQFCRQHSLLKVFMPPPFKNSPLLNFTWFLILSIDIGSAEVFMCLCDCYQPVIAWDPFYFEYLTKIGSFYFKCQRPDSDGPKGLLGLLGGTNISDLISSLNDGGMISHSLEDMSLFETAEGLD